MQNNTNNNVSNTSNPPLSPLVLLANAGEARANSSTQSESQIQSQTMPTTQNNSISDYSAEKYLQDCKENNNNIYSKLLFTMGIGLSDEERNQTKSDTLIKRKIIKKSDIKPSAETYMTEVTRRYSIIEQIETSQQVPKKDKTPVAKPKHWKGSKRENWLKEHPLTPSDKLFVMFTIEQFLTNIEKEADNEELERLSTGGNLSKPLKRTLRLDHAYFEGKNRDLFYRRDDSDTRQQLDAKNSDKLPDKFFDAVAKTYNDPNWVPDLCPHLGFTHLANKVKLPLQVEDDGTHHEYTAQQVKDHYINSKGKMNKAIAGWRRSGNGEALKNMDLSTVRVKFYGITYPEKEDTVADDDDDRDVEFLGDDRNKFVDNRADILYFWHLADLHDMVNDVSSNISVGDYEL
eukprot:CAMPEP_0178955046 /NCGR_PEP_ID=MMETSP0789-20121207/9369_1 /TAXON_ID=3005 /ORGANISM="Rhizosolenia setigera, Strain CCMP 1694" /LENGTH=402 /DNA_ID=CAMNT_0020636597 /DNA_START=49 /DNA_END=1257 /DNA_ORIENTATION=+